MSSQQIQLTLDDLRAKGIQNNMRWKQMENQGLLGRQKVQGKHTKMRAIIFQSDKQALLKVFSFQLIKLCIIQSQGNRKSNIECPRCIDSILELVQQQQFQIPITTDNQLLNSCSQQCLKSLLYQFFHQCLTPQSSSQQQQQHNSNPHSLYTPLCNLNKYPLILPILTGFLHQLLILGDIYLNYYDKLNMWVVYQFFSSYFNMEMYTDPHNNYIYFPETQLYVYQANPKVIYMIQQYDQKQMKVTKMQSRKTIVDDLKQQCQASEKSQEVQEQFQDNQFCQRRSVVSEQFSQIDVQQFSNILNSKNSTQEDGNGKVTQGKQLRVQQQVVVMLSDLNIGISTPQIPQTITPSSPIKSQQQQSQPKYKIAQSQIIFIPNNNTSININNRSQSSNFTQKQKQSTTTTYSSFRKNSATLGKDCIKAYLQNPTMLQSQFIQGQNQHIGDKQKKIGYADNKFKQYYEYTSQTFYKPDSISNNFFQPYQPYQPSSSSSNFCLAPLPSLTPSTNLNLNMNMNMNMHVNINKNVNGFNTNYNKNMNISQQYTNSFILEKVSQPYRSIIKAKKAKAREQRKNIYKIIGKF